MTVERLPETLELDPASLRGPVWVISPHPDDEGLGCGALTAALTELKVEVWALLLSDGGASHPASTDWPRARLTRQRLTEWQTGLDHLGVEAGQRRALALPDGALPFPGQAGGLEAVRGIRAALDLAPPATVLLPWRRDPHPDHRAAHALVWAALQGAEAVRWLEYTVWLSERGGPADWPRPGEALQWEVTTTGQRARKEAAIRAHHSQLGALVLDDPDGFVLPEAMVRRALERPERLLEGRP